MIDKKRERMTAKDFGAEARRRFGNDKMEHPLLQNEEGDDTHDDDPANMMFRAGYLTGMAMRCEQGGDDRKMLQRAARSLVLASRLCAGSTEPDRAASAALPGGEQ